MSDWYTNLDGLWARAWELLQAGGTHRFVTLATVSAYGPEARLVVLRRADQAAAQLVIYTDASSAKIAELQADPRASLHHWTPADDLQIRLGGRIEITTGVDLQAEWDALPKPQRQNYGVTPPPGTLIPDAAAYDRAPRFEQFARLTFTAERVDLVHLSPDTHRRALFTRAADWQGQWRAP